MITILAIGQKHEDWVKIGIERYETRLKKPYDVKWQLLPHSSLEEHRARDEESTRLLDKLDPKSYVVLLDEIGDMLNSPEFSARIERQFTNGKSVTIIIGGAYGVDDRLRARADFVWSLSDLVFPHQLVRLICIEQLYRAQEIERGGSYHHS